MTWWGRVRFLNAVRELAPRVVAELVALLDVEPAELEAAISEWAERWRLTSVDADRDHWVRAVALATLERWRRHPWTLELDDGPRWTFPSHAAPFTLSPDEEAEYQAARRGKRGRQPFHELAEARGFEPPPLLREPGAFSRLARYQVSGEPVEALAQAESIDSRTLREGLRRTARLIGLRRRSGGRPGRPRKR